MKFRQKDRSYDLVVAGGGMAGICAAIEASRGGLSVALVNNRGYLGGNASAEIRVSIEGADCGAEFNLNAREGGILEEIRLENIVRNPDRNPYVWDALLLDAVLGEKIDLYLNATVDEAVTTDGRILSVFATQSTTETRWKLSAETFIDDTGDGTLGFLAGADFMLGREAAAEYHERIAPDLADSFVLPSTLTFVAKKTGKPVKYIRPGFATDIEASGVLERREIPLDDFRNSQWYYELGGELDQTTDMEQIIQQHRALVYGIWDYIKNSGKYPAENDDLEFVSCFPGKRECRRLIGDYVLTETDIATRKEFDDAVGHGGWSIDLHAIQGFFARELVNFHYMARGIYQIPYRCCYSRNVSNLFMAGRCISTTHAAFGSTRVIATLCTLGQAVGAAAALCHIHGVLPRDIHVTYLQELQQILLAHDQFLPWIKGNESGDIARQAQIQASSELSFELEPQNGFVSLADDFALSLPAVEGIGELELMIRCRKDTEIRFHVYLPERQDQYNPNMLVASGSVNIQISAGFCPVRLPIHLPPTERYAFIQLSANKEVDVARAELDLPSVTCLSASRNSSPIMRNLETLEQLDQIWRPRKWLPCLKLIPQPASIFAVTNAVDGYARPYGTAHVWASEHDDTSPELIMRWNEPHQICAVQICFDTMLNRWINYIPDHDDRVFDRVPQSVTVFAEADGQWQQIASTDNIKRRRLRLDFDTIRTQRIRFVFDGHTGIYDLRVYSS